MEPMVSVRSLGKKYKIYPSSRARVLEALTFGRKVLHAEKWALRGVSFDVEPGSALGIVGSNGAGKSTLLKILTGTTMPTTGEFAVKGRIASLLELGAGFHPEFTGRDNVYMNAAISGIPKSDVRARFDELHDFAELGEYMDRPVRTYSSGMAMRLGFAAALLADPEVLILDEVFAVGDQHFQQKCIDRIHAIRKRNRTILFVSHSLYHVRQICDRAVWISDGCIVKEGDPIEVTDEYSNYQHSLGRRRTAVTAIAADARPSAAPEITDAHLCDAGGSGPATAFRTGEDLAARIRFRNPMAPRGVHLGIIILRNDDVMVAASRTLEHLPARTCAEGEVTVVFPAFRLLAGEYQASFYLMDEPMVHIHDQRLGAVRFKMTYGGMEKGIFLAEARWSAGAESPSGAGPASSEGGGRSA